MAAIECESVEFCSCGNNDNLVVTGFAWIFRYPDGSCPWTVRCFECKEEYMIDDEGRDQLFGTDWRAQPKETDGNTARQE